MRAGQRPAPTAESACKVAESPPESGDISVIYCRSEAACANGPTKGPGDRRADGRAEIGSMEGRTNKN